MADMITKTFRIEVKGVDENDGTIDMLIPMSTSSVDRDGEVIDPTAFKKSLKEFLKRPVLVSSHQYGDLMKQIGEFKTLKVTKDGLLGKPQYYIGQGNQEADWAFKLAQKGMAAYSVGFIPINWEDGDGEKTPKRTYHEAELLEISHVIVPSQREAIQGLRSKGVDPVVGQILDEVEKDLVTKPEETEDYIRIPVSEGHDGHRIRTIDISEKEGIKALYCGECKKVITYLFAKDHGWTMEKARVWVEEHKKTTWHIENDEALELVETVNLSCSVPNDNVISIPNKTQGELGDELDYIRAIIKEIGISDQNKQLAWDFVREVMNMGEIPDDIVSKIGAMVWQRDRAILIEAQQIINNILMQIPKEETIDLDEIVNQIHSRFR